MSGLLYPTYVFRLRVIKQKESFLNPITKSDKMMNFI